VGRYREKVTIRLDPEAHDHAVDAAGWARLTLAEWCERAVHRAAWDEMRERHRELCAIRRDLSGGGDHP
jgi:hypothetical protein